MNDLLDRPLRGPAIYNPDLLGKDELVRGFVARRDVLRLFVDDLRRVTGGGGVQHHLLVGQRGMGKTTLLRRLRYAVDDEPALRKAWLPLIFPEEQYEVAHLSDFYLNCIDALSDALEMRGSPDAARTLDRAVESLPDRPEEARAERALDLLIHTAKRLRVRLLLLLDNIDLLLHRLSDHHWTLRELLSSQDRLCVIGTSAAAIEATYDYGKAFYDFFQIHMLGGLTEDECREVLLALSRMFDTPAVEQWITQEPARLRALRLLTGGNPRTVVLLHTIAASGAGGDVRSDLERLLDQCTPLYKSRFESLPDQAQRVVHALALHWHPASAAEIAEAARLDVNAASSQLARLARDGVVEKVPFVPETKTGFQIAERFFNIWYLMRSSRRVRRRLVWLVEFLEMLYEGEELRAHARGALRGAAMATGDDAAVRHAGSALAFAEALEEESLKKALEGAAARALTILPDVRAKIAALVDLEGADDEFHARTWEEVLLFFHEAVRTGHAAEAGELLDETDLGERWLPLREALRILAAEDRSLLRKLAPEVREPVERLLERLSPSPSSTKEPATAKSEELPKAHAASARRRSARQPEPAHSPREARPRKEAPARGNRETSGKSPSARSAVLSRPKRTLEKTSGMADGRRKKPAAG